MDCSAIQNISVPNLGSSRVPRNTANFHTTIWGNRFIDYVCDDEDTCSKKEKQIEELKEKVRTNLILAARDVPKQLKLIDTLQLLGISYHFETEIEEALRNIYNMYHHGNVDDSDGDLYTVALRFRILREYGYSVTCDVFNKFRNKEGSFEEHLASNIEGLLSLYEAAHLRVQRGDILDGALAFTARHLKFEAARSSNPLATQIAHTLKRPLRKSIPRLEAKRYISIYQESPSHDENILKLAQLDFHILQSMHKKEVQDISLWWKKLDFATKLPFARDRLVECYFWSLGLYFEPQYSLARRMFTKVIIMTSIMDDIYDAYGTLDELKLFTDAIDRWNTNSTNQLPDYMKIYYKALMDLFEEIENEMAKEGNLYGVRCTIQAMKDLTKSYLKEATWCNQNYVPTIEEYMDVALVTSTYHMLSMFSFLGMGPITTKEVFDWAITRPKIVKASMTICRLMDDIIGHEFEQQRSHVASAIECYMKQHGVSKQQAKGELKKEVENAWKDINEECLRPTAVPLPFLLRVLNLSRVIDVVYKDQDNYTHVGQVMKDGLTALLIDPLPM